ncbi:PRC-barrel domain-containing protein [Roseivivax sediminis]|uniref:PRC-barrel domain-containing protein n=1 Tax=Roseivivax sediminis TaxID=936889 RepID=A0A1I1UAR8_9RHOB|nr:PRC-barrel domain-containing protein [Roseivivax sediminis]SFD67961.1 PRC-barrel domain-containing protein [Roseivivax sediminis]
MKLKALLMSAATAALFAGAATAQDDGSATGGAEAETEMEATEGTDSGSGMSGEGEAAEGEAAAPQEPAFTSIEEMMVGDVTGMNVFDSEGSRIGEVDYVIDQGDGAQAVIGIGGFLGLGEYTVAIPVSDFELSQDPMGFNLDTDRETLEQQPEFDESEVEPLPDDMMMSELMADDGGDMGSGASEGEDMGATGGEADDTTGGMSEDPGAATGDDAGTATGGAAEGEDAGGDMESGDMESGDAEMDTESEGEGETED